MEALHMLLKGSSLAFTVIMWNHIRSHSEVFQVLLLCIVHINQPTENYKTQPFSTTLNISLQSINF